MAVVFGLLLVAPGWESDLLGLAGTAALTLLQRASARQAEGALEPN